VINIEVSLEEQLLAEVVSAGKPHGLELAQIIREALLAWLKRHGGQQFEREWIAALKQNPDEASLAEDWFEAQAWSES